MTKHEFLQRLEAGLSTVAPEERVAALQYYTEYFDDAGVENEAEVIEAIGSPDQLAADIRAESGAPAPASPGPLDIGPAPTAPEPVVPIDEEAYRQGQQAAENMLRRTQFTQPGQESYPGGQQGWPNVQNGWNPPPPHPAGGFVQDIINTLGGAARAILLIFAIMLSPAIFGVLFAMVMVIFMLALVPFMLCIVFVAVGVACLPFSLTLLTLSFGNALLVLGTGLVFAGIGVLCGYGGVKAAKGGARACGAAFRGVGSVFSRLTRKGGYNHG